MLWVEINSIELIRFYKTEETPYLLFSYKYEINPAMTYPSFETMFIDIKIGTPVNLQPRCQCHRHWLSCYNITETEPTL
jgi:hypothetical protein